VSDDKDIASIQLQLIDLQSQLAFQEDTLQALNDVVTRQQQQIANLHELCTQQKDQLENLIGEQEGEIEEPRPPHY
jgi:SlyX protein